MSASKATVRDCAKWSAATCGIEGDRFGVHGAEEVDRTSRPLEHEQQRPLGPIPRSDTPRAVGRRGRLLDRRDARRRRLAGRTG